MGKSMSDNRINKNQPVGDELHEECGVFGMYDFDGGDVASTIYYGLFALQHRGQESCGIAVSETNGPKGKVTSYQRKCAAAGAQLCQGNSGAGAQR